MSNFPTTARVVIIGGGVVGTSTLFHLARAGWTDCVLLEKNELTAGSTWHAAGNCPNFAPNWAVMNMQRYGLEMYRGLADDVDYPMNYHVTGSVRLAHSKERMQEFAKASAQARAQGLELDVLTPQELRDYNPFLEIHDLEGGMWDSLDGDIDPAQLTQALAKGARDAGGNIQRFAPVTGIDRDGDEWIVKTEKGDIRAEYVVNCAGYYAQRVGEMFKPFGGRTVPMVTMSHQYFLTGQLPELEAWTKEKGHKMPMIRDPDISYYLRQDKNGLNLGPYERNCKAHWVTPDDPMPEDFSFQLYPDDLERLEFYIEDAMARLPLLGEGGVERNINGPIPYAPDGLPMIGPMPGVKNAFEGHSFTFGIAQGGGAGKVLAEWIMHGETEIDMWSVDPRRYTDYADHDYCHAKALETYGHEYAMHFPHHEWPAGRDKKLSALHSRLLDAGAQMGAYNGWERANWFAKPGDDTSHESTQTWDRNGPWQPRIKEEVEAVMNGCGILPITGFTRLAVEGPGARDYVDSLTASRLPSVGRVGLAYFADDRGRIVTEMSVIPRSDDTMWLITAATAQWHDFDVLAKGAPDGLTVHDRTLNHEALLVTGPKSRDILAAVSDADLSKGWLTYQEATVAGVDCVLLRVSFAGELGWEVHCPSDQSPQVWDAITGAGATPFGMYALNSMRLEKGYRAWKQDLSTDYTLFEGGLDRFVKLDKPQDFPGKAALLAEKEEGRAKGFVTLVMEPGEADAPYMSPIYLGDEIVGEVTSCAMGYRTGKCVALGMVRAGLAVPGTALEIDVFGNRQAAVVQEDAPVWDPENARLRA